MSNELTKEQIGFLNRYTKKTKGTWTYDAATGLVDVDGDFDCENLHSIKIHDFNGVRFGKVSGNFNCSFNKLTSLEGAPQEVGGDFSCCGNNLTSLKGAPQEVGGIFNCGANNLTSLEGAPQEVGGYFDCVYNNLTSLEGAPQKVGGGFKSDIITMGDYSSIGIVKTINLLKSFLDERFGERNKEELKLYLDLDHIGL